MNLCWNIFGEKNKIMMINGINNINNTNFKAKFVGKTEIKKLNTLKNEYEKYGVSFLEFDASNKNDLKAMKNISRYWCDSQFAWDVCQSADAIFHEALNPKTNKVYLLTKQKDNFEKLKPDEVLGLADVETKKYENGEDYLYIHRLQTNPDFLDKEQPFFKHIGTGILNILKSFNKVIELNSISSARGFYKNNEFINFQDSYLKFRWTPDKLK